MDLSHNRLRLWSFAGLQLGDLWLSYNGVPSLDAVGCLKDVLLTCLYLDHNRPRPRVNHISRRVFRRVPCAACSARAVLAASSLVDAVAPRAALRELPRNGALHSRREPRAGRATLAASPNCPVGHPGTCTAVGPAATAARAQVWQFGEAMASTAAGGVHRHAVAATVVGEEVESRRRHLVVGEEVRPAAVGHDDLERVAGQRRAGRID